MHLGRCLGCFGLTSMCRDTFSPGNRSKMVHTIADICSTMCIKMLQVIANVCFLAKMQSSGKCVNDKG